MQSETENPDYLYDFIYADTKRISSYLSQIDPTGVITAIKEVVGESDSVDTSGELNVKLFKAALKGVGINSQSLERQFDATPTLPWSLLHLLREQGYLGDDLASTPVGRMVFLKGSLSIIDVRLLKDAWRPNVEVLRLDNQNALDAQKERGLLNGKAYQDAKRDLDKRMEYEAAIVEMLEKLPHTVNITFRTNQGNCWAATSGANFLVDPEELILKHGPDISGVWYMASIIDAPPEPESDLPPIDGQGKLSDLILRSTKFIRHHFGRPAEHYAVTPIAIYRAVERPK